MTDPENDLHSLLYSSVEETKWQDLHELVEQKLREILSTNPSDLHLVFYRLDVSELAVQHAMQKTELSEIVTALTALVIERQKLRLATRERYKDFFSEEGDF